MPIEYQVTQQEILDAARALIGTPYVHQGRSAETGVDCIGFCKVVAQNVGYPFLFDDNDYGLHFKPRRLIRSLLKNLDEIKLEEFGPADILLLKTEKSDQARHVAFCETLAHGWGKDLEGTMLHAPNKIGISEVTRDPIPRSRLVKAFRVRGLIL